MTSKDSKFFSNADIDSIHLDPSDNYFSPVLRDVRALIGDLSYVSDIGCGNGVFSESLKALFKCYLTGVDGSEYALQQSSKRQCFDRILLVENLSSDAIPIPDKECNLVLCKDVLEHLLSPDHLVAEISRITTSNGYCLVSVPNHFNICGRLSLLFLNQLDPFRYFPHSNRWNFPHIRFFRVSDLHDLFLCAGFEPVQSYSSYFPVMPIVSRFFHIRFRRYLARRFPDLFSEALVFLYQKV